MNDPQHDYTQRLLMAAPSLTSRSMVSARRPDDAAGPETEATVENIVEVRNLSKVFTIRGPGSRGGTAFTAVDDISFSIPRGQTVSIVGESGSGKSTTANLMLGLDGITSGQILFDGTEVSSLGRRELFAFRRRVQPVFQNPYASLDPRYTIAESITEPLRVHRIGTKAVRHHRCLELLDQVALPATMADRLPHELSGGQRQRVAIARALALSPDLVVLDEAVSALDVLVQAQTLDLLAELQNDLGLSYLFISHDLAVVRMISHAVHVMQRGRIVESGTPADIFEQPQAAYTRELLAAIPAVNSGA
jgi:peptide/nickel transport system ATP-binding protein